RMVRPGANRAHENDRAGAVRNPRDRRSRLGGRTVQQTGHFLFEAVVERFLRRGLGVGPLAARAFRGVGGGCRRRFIAGRRGGLGGRLGRRGWRRAGVVAPERRAQRHVGPGGGRRRGESLALGRGLARCLGCRRRRAGVLTLARTSQRGLQPLRHFREILVGRRLERGVGSARGSRRRRLQPRHAPRRRFGGLGSARHAGQFFRQAGQRGGGARAALARRRGEARRRGPPRGLRALPAAAAPPQPPRPRPPRR